MGRDIMNHLKKLQDVVAIFLAALLLVAGITGSILAFYNEVDAALNPGFYHVEPAGRMLPPPVLIENLEAARPEISVWYLQYPESAGDTAMLTAEPRPDAHGQLPAIESNTFYLDPYTGNIVGERFWGRCCFEPPNFVNFIYEIHHSLKSGAWGGYLMGLAACILLLNCLVALFRGMGKRVPAKGLFLIPATRKPLMIALAVLLFPVAFSSIAMNLADEIFKPAVSLFSPVKDSIYTEYSRKEQTDFGPRQLSYEDAYRLALEKGAELGLHGPVAELFYSTGYNFYGMGFGYRDPPGMGNVWIYLDGADGHTVGLRTPRQGTPGDLLFNVQLPIHSGRLAGLPGKVAIALLGLLVAGLSCRYILVTAKGLFKPGNGAWNKKKKPA